MAEVAKELRACESVNAARSLWEGKEITPDSTYYEELDELAFGESTLWAIDLDMECEVDCESLFEVLCVNGAKDAIQLLLEISPDIKTEEHARRALVSVIELAKFDFARFLVESGVPAKAELYEPPPLLYACEQKNPDLVKFLLKHGADPLQSYADYNKFPIHGCPLDLEIVTLLVEKGGINQIFEQTNIPEWPLGSALADGYEGILLYYLSYLESDDFKWDKSIVVAFPVLEKCDKVSYDIKKRLLLSLSRSGYFENDSDFIQSVKQTGVAMTDLWSLAEFFPDVAFPNPPKSARK